MRNERKPRKAGRTGLTGYKGKTSSRDSKKPGGRRSASGTKKYLKGDKEFVDKKSFSSKSQHKKKLGTDKDSSKKGERKSYIQKPLGEQNSFSSKISFKKKVGDKDSSFKSGREFTYSDKKIIKKSGGYADYKKKGFDDKKKNTDDRFTERKEYKRVTGKKTYTDKNNPDKIYTKETEIVRNKDASKGFVKKKVYQPFTTNTDNKSVADKVQSDKNDDGLIRLNKFIANAGICSRREADTFIQTGVVSVNGEIITVLGYKVKPDDRVLFGDKPIIGEKPVYILLNKPKDYITTSKDPQNRKTVLDLITGVKERVFPIGRLDRKTTGVLLLTNDGPLAEKLMHPRKGVTKIYHVELDYRFSAPDMEKLRNGLELEEGFFKPDVVDYVEGMDKHHVGIEIHSGANHIVRRLFEALDYNVIKLDRVVYAGLTKKGLTRGKWRFLTDFELHALKMM